MPAPIKKAHQLNYNRFLKFHPNANGDNGRPVFIDPELIIRFMELINVDDEQDRNLAREITEKLKAIAGGATSDSNLNNASQHRDYFVRQNVYVTYSILQASPSNRGSGVYITDLERAVKDEKQGGPGLYKATFDTRSGDDWRPAETTNTVMTTALGAIGALEPTSGAETSVRASANAFGSYLITKDMRRLQNEYSLFYTPAYVIDHYGTWIGAEQKTGKEKGSPQALAKLLQNTENSFWAPTDNRYCWYVFGQGAKQLLAALQHYRAQQKYPLGRHHEFVFVDPKVPMGELKSALHHVGIDLTPDMIKLDNTSLSSKMHVIADGQATYQSFHRNSRQESQLNKAITAAKDQYSKRTQDVYFVDIVKGLQTALNGGWI
ncbi:MAG TPA: hypothetical protein VIC26_02800 [Marinagarivorans sp.]